MKQRYCWRGITAGIFTMFGAFTIAGMATITSESGGVYEYLRISMGNFFSFLFGWIVFAIMGSGSIAALAFVFAQSLNTLVHIPDPLFALKDVSIGQFYYAICQLWRKDGSDRFYRRAYMGKLYGHKMAAL